MLVAVGLDREGATHKDAARPSAWATDELAQALSAHARFDGVDEVLVVSPGERLEIYAASRCPSAAVVAIRQALSERMGRELRLSEHVGEDAFRQLARIASGLESSASGASGVLRQVNDALSRAAEVGAAGPELTAAARRAFQVAQRVHVEAGIGEADTSWGDAVFAVAEKVLGPLGGRRVAAVGGGDLVRAAAQQARDRSARVVVIDDAPRAGFAAEIGAEQAGLDALADELFHADVVVFGSRPAPEPLSAARVTRLMRARRRRLVLIDLAAPRAVDPGAGAAEDVFLLDVDDLRKVLRAALAERAAAVALAERIVEEEVARFGRAEPARASLEMLDLRGAVRDERAAG